MDKNKILRQIPRVDRLLEEPESAETLQSIWKRKRHRDHSEGLECFRETDFYGGRRTEERSEVQKCETLKDSSLVSYEQHKQKNDGNFGDLFFSNEYLMPQG